MHIRMHTCRGEEEHKCPGVGGSNIDNRDSPAPPPPPPPPPPERFFCLFMEKKDIIFLKFILKNKLKLNLNKLNLKL